MAKDNEDQDVNKEDIWKDPRFSHLVSDPRFKSLPTSQRKVKIDKRFQSMFHDKKFKVKYTVDKYGRRVDKSSSEDLRKYYEIDSSDEDEDEERRKEEKQISKVDEEIYDVTLGNDALSNDGQNLDISIRTKLLDSGTDFARGEGRIISDSSSDDELSDEDDEIYIEHVWGELAADADSTSDSTRRLAACNMDWDRIRAIDIVVLCSSFLPPGGSILSVKIYPSEFGKERMSEEELNGPAELTEKKENENLNSDDEDSEGFVDNDSDVEEGDEYHMEKLRQYQLNRLKYYYAVIECDSVATADKLYKECDGIEYESTATKLDLRFIPDETTFDEDEPKDVCTELPDTNKYKPRLFTTTALQQAKVELTWDETNVERKELTEKLASGKLDEVRDSDIRKFVAYSSEEENEDDHQTNEIQSENEEKPKLINSEAQILKYKSLLDEIEKKQSEKAENKYEMEYTWGINVDSKLKIDSDIKKSKKTLTPIEKVLEKKHEKNKKRKEERKNRQKNNNDNATSYDSDDIPDGIDMNDSYFAEEFEHNDFELPKSTKSKIQNKKSKGNNKNSEFDKEDEIRNTKQLELLLDDGDDGKKHFSLDKILKSENDSKSKKRRKNKKNENSTSKDNDDFQINVNDERFKSIYTSHLYNIDPTDSHFKKTKGMSQIVEEKLKRRREKPEMKGINIADDDVGHPKEKRSKEHIENIMLVKSVKRKIENAKKRLH